MILGKPWVKNPSIRLKTIYPPSNGTLVVRLQILDTMVDRVLIDNGSEVKILFRGAATRMDILDRVNSIKFTI